ncbi:MAG: hypothetical protein ACKOU6_09335 [Planctomycetota bacterium]
MNILLDLDTHSWFVEKPETVYRLCGALSQLGVTLHLYGRRSIDNLTVVPDRAAAIAQSMQAHEVQIIKSFSW